MRRLLVLGFLIVGPVHACNVPVFRYALEHWSPSPYELVVFHKVPLSPAQQQRLDQLQKHKLNLTLRTVDIRQPMTAADKTLRGDHPLPWVSLRFPESDASAPAAWEGPIDQLSNSLGDSPARRELVAALARGTSIVWVILDGDETTERLLRDELSRLEKTLKLPEVDPADLTTSLPLRLTFAVVKIGRIGPEADLARELIASDEEFHTVRGPMVFPVVGRGRVLFGLHGKGLTAGEIAGSAAFACGACSCRVKELNPGVDLLLRADWPKLLLVTDTPERQGPPLVAPPIPVGSISPVELTPDSRRTGSRWLPLVVLLGVVGVGWWGVRSWSAGLQKSTGPDDVVGIQ